MGNTVSAYPQPPSERRGDTVINISQSQQVQPPIPVPVQIGTRQNTNMEPQPGSGAETSTEMHQVLQPECNLADFRNNDEPYLTSRLQLRSVNMDVRPLEYRIPDCGCVNHAQDAGLHDVAQGQTGEPGQRENRKKLVQEMRKDRSKRIHNCLQGVRKAIRRLYESTELERDKRLSVLRRTVVKANRLVRQIERAWAEGDVSPLITEAYALVKAELDEAMEACVYEHQDKLIPEINRSIWVRHNFRKAVNADCSNAVDEQSTRVGISTGRHESPGDEIQSAFD